MSKKELSKFTNMQVGEAARNLKRQSVGRPKQEAGTQRPSEAKYSGAPVSTGNTFQDLPRLRETADNTERFI
jgi:hypothetical protein